MRIHRNMMFLGVSGLRDDNRIKYWADFSFELNDNPEHNRPCLEFAADRERKGFGLPISTRVKAPFLSIRNLSRSW